MMAARGSEFGRGGGVRRVGEQRGDWWGFQVAVRGRWHQGNPISDLYFQLYYKQDEIKLFLIMNLFIFIAQHKYSANASIIFKNNLRLKKSQGDECAKRICLHSRGLYSGPSAKSGMAGKIYKGRSIQVLHQLTLKLHSSPQVRQFGKVQY